MLGTSSQPIWELEYFLEKMLLAVAAAVVIALGWECREHCDCSLRFGIGSCLMPQLDSTNLYKNRCIDPTKGLTRQDKSLISILLTYRKATVTSSFHRWINTF